MTVQFGIEIAVQTLLLGLLAVGFYLALGATGFFDFSLAAHLVVAPFLAHALIPLLGVHAALIMGVLGSGAIAFCLWTSVYSRIIRKRGSELMQLVAAIAVYTILQNLCSFLFGPFAMVVAYSNVEAFRIGAYSVSVVRLFGAGVSVALLTAIFLLSRYTYVGLAWRALASDRALATQMGLPVRALQASTVVLAAILAGVVGSIQALDTGLYPYMGINLFILAATAALLGGTGGIRGIMGALLVLVLVRNLSIWLGAAEWKDVITYALLLALLAAPIPAGWRS